MKSTVSGPVAVTRLTMRRTLLAAAKPRAGSSSRLEGVHDRLRIEGSTVVKAHAFAQLQRPSGSRRVYAPFCGQARRHIEVLIEPHETFIHWIQNVHGEAGSVVSRIHG